MAWLNMGHIVGRRLVMVGVLAGRQAGRQADRYGDVP
jgi:hypothetical protein